MENKKNIKVRTTLQGKKQPGFKKYRELYYGKTSLWYVLKAELVTALTGSLPGALGLFLRQKYCKNGNIHLKQDVNISSFCTVFSSNKLTIEENSMIGAYSYMLSGGEYDYTDTETKFADQTDMKTKGKLVIGANCWIGAKVTILDAACVSKHCVIGAGAVVTAPIPKDSLAVGVPYRLCLCL